MTARPSYSDSAACSQLMLRDAARQLYKDKHVVRLLEPFFLSGPILEIGSGIGQIASLLRDRGHSVIASDVESWMIDFMIANGLNAIYVDARNILAHIHDQIPNIVAQGPSPLVTANLDTVRQTYRSIHAALTLPGRFILILPDFRGRAGFSTLKDHIQIISEFGFTTIALFRHQLFPSAVYRFLPTWAHDLLEGTFGRILGVRHIIILEKVPR